MNDNSVLKLESLSISSHDSSFLLVEKKGVNVEKN